MWPGWWPTPARGDDGVYAPSDVGRLDSWQELSRYAIRIDLGEGVSMSVLSLEGLLLTKEGMRDKDKADRAVLLRALGREP